MSDELMLGIIWISILILILASHIVIFRKPKNYEWRRNMRARNRWIEMLKENKR
jgi:hypothetical protein